MGKRKRKKKKQWICLGTIIVVLAIVLAILIFQKLQLDNEEDTGAQDSSVEQGDEMEEENVTVLYRSQEIEVYSFFPSSAVNVDSMSEFVDNVASIEFKNISGTYLERCEIQVIADNGVTYQFVAEEIAANMEVIAFETSSKTISDATEVANIEGTAITGTDENLLEDQVKVTEEEMEVTITNTGEQDLEHVVIVCHCVMDDVSYGGSKYEYEVESLASGETKVIKAIDCYFGQAKAVRVFVR